MKTFELLTSQTQIFQARRTMLGWFMPYGRTGLLKCLKSARLASGARAGIARLRARGIRTALVSISWRFAVDWLAEDLGADYAIGTDWLEAGEVVNFWPDDKVTWLAALLQELCLSPRALVAIGDSAGDIPMLKFAGQGYFVGLKMPPLLAHVGLWPDANIEELVDDIVRLTTGND